MGHVNGHLVLFSSNSQELWNSGEHSPMNFKRTYGLDPWARQKKTIWEIHNKHITVFHALHPNEGCPSFKSSTQYGCNMNPPLNAACHSFQRFSLLQNPTPFNLGTPHPSEESSFNEVTVAPTPP